MKKYSREIVFDFKPEHSYRLEVLAFKPSGALAIRVGSEDNIRLMGVTLTREEAEQLAQALADWLAAKEAQ